VFLKIKVFYGYFGPPPRLPYCDFKEREGFYFYSYSELPPRLLYCDFKEREGFYFYSYSGPPPRLPYQERSLRKRGKVEKENTAALDPLQNCCKLFFG